VRKLARQSADTTLDEAADVADPAAGPAETAGRAETGKLMRRAMLGLSNDHQEVLRLVFFEDLPYEEIASLLAIPTNTVKTRVYYARQQLKQRLDGLIARGAL
jgi:RNA polymerase sigma-70 factor (ECF subfamily)